MLCPRHKSTDVHTSAAGRSVRPYSCTASGFSATFWRSETCQIRPGAVVVKFSVTNTLRTLQQEA